MQLNNKIYDKIVKLCEAGDDFFKSNDYGRAAEKYSMALDLIPLPKEEWEASTWVYAALGDVYYQKHDYNSAMKYFINAQKCPDGAANPFINLRTGECYYELKEMDNAKDYLLRTYMLQGDDIFKNEPLRYYNLVTPLIKGSNKTDKNNIDKVENVPVVSSNIDTSGMIDEYGQLWKEGKYDKCIAMLENTWDKLPGDKYSCSESFLIVWFILKAAIKIGNKNIMKKWADKIFYADPSRDNNGERELWAGKAAYELEDYKAAFDYFLAAYKKSDGGRCFTPNDKKYLDFFKSKC